MKVVKRIVIGFVALIVLLIGTAIIIPIFFKDKILAAVKKAANENLNATVDFKDLDLSILRSFPRLSVSLTGASIIGKDDFKSDTLVAAGSINVALDIMKAINGEYEILNIGLDDARIHAIVLADGRANWDIAKPSPETKPSEEPSTPFALKLKKYSISKTFIEYDDRQGKMHAIIRNLDHSGSGDFTSDAFTLATKTTADAITFINAGIPYLNKVKTAIDLDLQIDNKASKYTFNTDKIQLNGLKLYTKGFVQMPDTSTIAMDVQFGTPSNDFKDILSLVPGIYTADFKDVKTTGKLKLNGFVKGKYTASQMPSFMLNLAIADGSFQYPALPQKVSDIQVDLQVINPDGVTDHTVVDLKKCHIVLGLEPFDLRMLMRQPVSEQWVDAYAKGHIDLSRMGQFVTLEQGTKIAGQVNADVSFKGSMAQAQNKQFDKVDASGTISIADFSYVAKDYPDGVAINSLLLTFNPKNVTVSNLRGRYMGTNFSGSGSVDNLLGYYMSDQALKGTFSLVADQVDVNKFMGTPSSTPEQPAAAPATDPFVVPANLNVDLSTSIGTIKYDDITLTGVNGGLAIANEAVTLKNLSGKALDGMFRMSGSYSTKANKKNPAIAFDYSVQAVDIQKTYNSFATVQKMMPAAKYMSGKVTSNLTVNGRMNPDMTPDVNTLSGKGDLMMLGGLLSGFPITDQLADKLKLTQFKTINMQDVKIFFTFENGRVSVEPYKMKIGKDIEAEIAGSHGFDQTLKYGANFVVPRSLLGSAGNAMLNNLVSQAASKGVPITLGEKINFTATITGTTTSPKVETDLKNIANNALNNVKEEIKKVIEKKVDSVKTVVRDTVNALKEEAKRKAEEARKQAEAEAKRRAEEELRKQMEAQSNKAREEAAKKAAKEAEEKAKEGLKGLFKKK
ncbi:MAG: AsmA family protein [Taibaiella sp.]|nr:AsmA family protein [Taibaiella sp.]